MAVNIHITIIELNALHTKRQNLFQELDAVIHLLMEAKHWGLRKSRNATSLNSRFKSLDTLKVKIISVTFRRVIRTNHKKASKISLILHLGNLFLIVQLHFSKLFLILKSGVNHTSRGSISTSTLPSIKLRKCSSKIITSILSFISGRLATKSNQIKQLIRNGRS